MHPARHYFALLGLAAQPGRYRGHQWRIPDGEISWIRWIADETTPALTMGNDLPEEHREWMPGAGRLLIRVDGFDEFSAEDYAGDVADAISGMLATPYSPFTIEMSVIRLDSQWIDSGAVDANVLAERADLRADPFAQARLRDLADIPVEVERALGRLDAVLMDGDRRKTGILPALVFWRLAVDDYAFGPHEISEIFDEPEMVPHGAMARAQTEQSVQNAFKAFEALIGGWPPKDSNRLAKRLSERGLDPGIDPFENDERNMTLVARVEEMRELRSQHAAHAGETGVSERRITWLELMRTHATVRFCINQAIDGSDA